jgi:hypothetical protein
MKKDEPSQKAVYHFVGKGNLTQTFQYYIIMD